MNRKSTLLIAASLFSITNLFASDKLLDAFTATGNYYMSGGITVAIDQTTYQEGNSSLAVNYAISSGSFGEIYRSYGTNTLDLSFNPLGLTFWLKGQAGQSGNLKVMLYEDINMNGSPFDAGDEIWEYSTGANLATTNWTEISSNYSNFTKFGGGTGTLDLNRIAAWRLVIENSTGNSLNGKIWVDNLRQQTSYEAPSSGTAKLSGSFIQLWNTAGCNCGGWDQATWEKHMDKMKDVCLDKLVVQYGFYDNNSWYSPSSASFKVYTNNTLNNIMAAAAAKGIDVYIGTYFDETWNTMNKDQQSNYDQVLAKHKVVIDEIYGLFGSNPQFKGWYIPQEIDDYNWQTSTRRNMLANWLQQTAAYAKGKDATKKIMIAPFFGPFQPADVLQTWYENLLTTATSVDIIAPQDGVGTGTKDVDVDVPYYFSAIKNAAINKGRDFWATIESFQNNPNTNTGIAGDINTLKSQIWEGARHTDTMIQFEWGYMQPELSTATQQLYDDYKTYADCGIVTAISDRELTGGLVVAPNPFESEISIKGDTPFSVDVYNAQGLYMHTVISENNIIRTGSNWQSGLYFLKVKVNGKETSYKTLKH